MTRKSIGRIALSLIRKSSAIRGKRTRFGVDCVAEILLLSTLLFANISCELLNDRSRSCRFVLGEDGRLLGKFALDQRIDLAKLPGKSGNWSEKDYGNGREYKTGFFEGYTVTLNQQNEVVILTILDRTQLCGPLSSSTSLEQWSDFYVSLGMQSEIWNSQRDNTRILSLRGRGLRIILTEGGQLPDRFTIANQGALHGTPD